MRKPADSELTPLTPSFSNPANSPVVNHSAGPSDGREMLLHGYQLTTEGSGLLKDSLSLSQNTEATAAGILTELDTQRGLIQLVGSRIDDASAHAKRADKTVSTMFRRVATNKCVIGLIITILLGTIALILFVRFIGFPSHSNSTRSALPRGLGGLR